MIRVYFDTETTGFANSGTLAEQPHIVQLAAILVDDEEGELASMNTIIKPTGWEVGSGAAAVHGISTEKASRFGIPILTAMAMFSNLCRVAEQVVAHNINFDRKLVGFEVDRLDRENILETKPQFCTMDATTNICKIRNKRGGYKWPKLSEAHIHFFGEDFTGAHDALADVRACARIHKHLIEQGIVK